LINSEEKSFWNSVSWINFKANIISATTVALISIPLSISLAIASKLDPNYGIQAAIYGPIIMGLLGGSDFNICGPAGALASIVSE